MVFERNTVRPQILMSKDQYFVPVSYEGADPMGIDALSPSTDTIIKKTVREEYPPSPIGFSPKNSPKPSSSPIQWEAQSHHSPPPQHITKLFGNSSSFPTIFNNPADVNTSYNDEQQSSRSRASSYGEFDKDDFEDGDLPMSVIQATSSLNLDGTAPNGRYEEETTVFEMDESLKFDSTGSSRSSSPIIDPTTGSAHDAYSTFHGEHPLGEHPSRTLFVRNINSNVEDEELVNLFEVHGPIRSIYTQCKHRGFVMISYFDIRHAKNAMRNLQGKALRRRKLDIHYSIPKDNPSEKDQNQGTLVIFNLDASIVNEELKSIFGAYGEIKEIRETPNKKHHKFIEFFDVRDADKAMKCLNKTEVKGKKIKIEPSRRGGVPKNNVMQNFSEQYVDEDDEPQQTTVFITSRITKSESCEGQYYSSSFQNNKQGSSSFSTLPGFSPIVSPDVQRHKPMQTLTKSFSTNSASPQDPLFSPAKFNSIPSPPTSLFQNAMSANWSNPFSSSPVSPSPSLGHNQNGFPSSLESHFSPYPSNPEPKAVFTPIIPMGSTNNIPIVPITPIPTSESPQRHSFESPREKSENYRRKYNDEDRSKFFLNVEVTMGDDRRTTLMIKNIPNKYSQKMLLSAVDEHFKGLIDFFYLPIDFKNKCNVGYAFINFIDYSNISAFHAEFHNKKWEKFNSEKVCELTYARIQGKTNLIAHFQNSSLMVEDKKCRPIIFHSDGPNMGEQEPFPMGPNIRKRSSGSRDDGRPRPAKNSFS